MRLWRKETFSDKLLRQFQSVFFREQLVTVDVTFKVFVPPDPRRVVLVIPAVTGLAGGIELRPPGGASASGFIVNVTNNLLVFDIDHDYSIPQNGFEGKTSILTPNVPFWEVLYCGK